MFFSAKDPLQDRDVLDLTSGSKESESYRFVSLERNLTKSLAAGLVYYFVW